MAKPLLGKDVLSDDLPYVTGSIGLLGTRPSYEMMMHCDTLLTVGSSFPYTQFLPAFGQARGVQIDIDGKFTGMRYPNEVNLVGGSAATLRAPIPHLKGKGDRSWREGIGPARRQAAGAGLGRPPSGASTSGGWPMSSGDGASAAGLYDGDLAPRAALRCRPRPRTWTCSFTSHPPRT